MENILNFLKNNGITGSITIGSIVDGDGTGLFSTSGLKPSFYFDDTMVTYDGLQIVVRNTSYVEGEKIINSIFSLLNKINGYTPQQSPFFIGHDEKNRSEFSVNYIITKEGAK